MSPLYQRWLAVASKFEDENALVDRASGKVWTFAELRAIGEEREIEACDGVVFAEGKSVEFIFETLAAWREGYVLCPFEKGGSAPDLHGFEVEDFPEIAHLKTTSGSTGSPKLVLFTAAQLAADFDKIEETMELCRDIPNLGVISLAHSYGFSNLVLPLLLGGISLQWVGNPLPEVVKSALEDTYLGSEKGRWVLPAVPAMWRAWHRSGDVLNKAHIAIAISAGAPLPVDLEREIFENEGLKIHNFYGSTECGGIAYDASGKPRDAGAHFVGKAMADTQLSIDSNTGCLAIEGGAVATGYLPADQSVLGGGRFVTSDIARISKAGEVFLEGRCSDRINVAGRKISPERIESTLEKNEAVRYAVVFGVPSEDSTRVEEIVAVVNTTLTEAELRHSLNSLQTWERPRHWWISDELVPDVRGKISRNRWRDRWLDHVRATTT